MSRKEFSLWKLSLALDWHKVKPAAYDFENVDVKVYDGLLFFLKLSLKVAAMTAGAWFLLKGKSNKTIMDFYEKTFKSSYKND